jgi:hypothetical protein
MLAFDMAMGQLGVQNNVTTFTESDFGRTLTPQTCVAENGRKWQGFDFSARTSVFAKSLLLQDLLAFASAMLDRISATNRTRRRNGNEKAPHKHAGRPDKPDNGAVSSKR